MKRSAKETLAEPSAKKRKQETFSISELADGVAQITKKLLGLGAENNWTDITNSDGRSLNAAKYRANWLYLSSSDRGQDSELSNRTNKDNWFDTFKSGVSQTFFYYTCKTESRTHRGYIARNAAAAVLSLTGSCDQHAYVTATLLRSILPKGTLINICGLKQGDISIPHTFVVIGNVGSHKTINLTKPLLQNLLAVDAWPTQGGAVKLEDYFLCSEPKAEMVLVIDQSIIADGVDHLVKRIKKQNLLFDIVSEKHPNIQIKKSDYLSRFIHHDLEEQINYTNLIKRDPYLSSSSLDYEDIFEVDLISDKYIKPVRSKEIFEYICQIYPHEEFQRCLEYSNEQLTAIISADTAPEKEISKKII